MKLFYYVIPICLFSISQSTAQEERKNPLLTDFNVPVEYAKVTSKDVEQYAKNTVADISTMIASIKKQKTPNFTNIFVALDDIRNKTNTTSNICFMLYWVSTDEATRNKGLAGYQLLDSLSTSLYSDKEIYTKMKAVKASPEYNQLKENRKLLVDQMMQGFEQSGVNLSDDKIQKFKKLTQEISELSSTYATNMNSSNETLIFEEAAMAGIPDDFKNKYKVANRYEIPVINSTNEPMMNNASVEATRRSFYFMFNNRAAAKNMTVLDQMVKKRDELAKLLGYSSFAAYNLVPKMAKNPQTVWKFVNDLIALSKDKAKTDLKQLEDVKKAENPDDPTATLEPWDIGYYKNQILKKEYNVNSEELRAYFPMDKCLNGLFTIYQKLLGLEFRKVKNASVWHEEVEMYEVYENNKLKGRFYLDLFPRPNKETWFYGVNMISGKQTDKGYEIPTAMLLGNFTRPTKDLPSLLSHKELNTLFHEFGHIMNMMSYTGEFCTQSESKADFTEAMSQIFENWTWDYSILSSFAQNYKTGEVLPKATFDNMVKAKNLASGFNAINSLRKCLYDMNLYDKYNAAAPVSTDKLWQNIDEQLGIMPLYVEGTHPQASWIHINTHPVYYYGYLWSEVYAKDMFTEFKKNGLTDTKTGVRYRELILSNGTQRDIVKAVEEFLGRPSNNEAYIKGLGL